LKKYLLLIIFFLSLVLPGCVSSSGNDDDLMIYKVLSPEPEWIRNGEPLEFEGELWYPRDTIDVLTDSEVIPLGEYREISFYLQRIDVRPFDRLYTKFGKNKYRVFETKSQNDSSHRAF
jgi:hypothetical protein